MSVHKSSSEGCYTQVAIAIWGDRSLSLIDRLNTSQAIKFSIAYTKLTGASPREIKLQQTVTLTAMHMHYDTNKTKRFSIKIFLIKLGLLSNCTKLRLDF